MRILLFAGAMGQARFSFMHEKSAANFADTGAAGTRGRARRYAIIAGDGHRGLAHDSKTTPTAGT
jgi:hypothetical protein